MDQAKSRKLLFKEFDRLGPIHEPWIRREPQLIVEPTNDVQAKGMERADPGSSRRLGLMCS